jgi:hypothetical protein
MSPDPSARQVWRDHFDKIAVTRVQTADQLTVRREALIAAVSAYFAAKSPSRLAGGRKRSTTSAVVQARGRLKNTWKCDDAWIRRLDDLASQFEFAPSKFELSKFLDFPPRSYEPASRPNRKKSHVA